MNTQPPANSAETILFAALDHAPEDREAFLATACGEDAALLAEVRALLAAHEAMPESFLAEPAVNDILERDLDVTIKAAPGTLPQRSGASLPDSTTVKTLPAGSQTSAGSSTANPSAAVPFIFGKRIAQGGMGAILEAEDCKLGRTIAAKVMLLEQDASEDMRQRFIQEAAVLAKLAHPNIVPVYDLGHDDEGQLYYTMKLVKGRTLQNILDDLRHERPEALREYTLERLLTIFRKVADALAFAHSKGIIHRDLKPENIMVGEFGEVLLMDWGLAKLLGSSNDATQSRSETRMTNAEGGKSQDGAQAADDPHSSFGIPHSSFTAPGSASISHTMQGAVMGTPKYMSPEQAMGLIDELDARSDIFSLGGILYAILTLRPPVEGKTVEEVLAKVSSASITAPTAFGATASSGAKQAKGDVLEAKQIKPLPHIPAGRVPGALSAVAMKALRLDKARRYQDVAAFSADIEAYQTGFATTAEEAGLGKQLVLLIKRHKGIFTTAAAAWLLITALAVWFVFSIRASERETRRQADIAKGAEAIAVQEKETARQALAKSQLDLAEKEFHLGKFVEAEKILDETPESFRDANWRFLQAHSRDFTAGMSITQKGEVNQLKFLPQGDRFAVRCTQGFVGFFNLAGRQEGEWIPVDRRFPTTPIGIDRTGSMAALVVSANEIAIHEVATGKLVRRWTCEISSISLAWLSPDGGTVLAADGKKLIAYATQTGAPLWQQPYAATAPAISPDGLTVANLADRNGLEMNVQLLDAATGAVRTTLTATADHPDKSGLHFNRTGDQLALLGGDEVILWNPQTGVRIRALHLPGERVTRLSPGGDAVASFRSGRIRLWDTTSGRLLRSFHGAGTEVKGIAFSPDGKLLLSSHRGGGDGNVKIWPTRLGEEIASMYRADAATGRVIISRDGSKFYTGGRDGAVASEIKTGLQKWTSSQNTGRILDLAIHPTDGSIILSDMGQQTLKHLSQAGEVLEVLGQVRQSSVKFNRGGQLLLAVERAFNLTEPGLSFSVMEYPSGKVLRKVPFKKDSLQPFAAFCLDDAAVATAALAGGITVWDWQTGTPLRQIDATQTGSIGCLSASPDGLHLASGGPDRWIRVWEAATGRLEAAFRAHWEGVSSIEFSPDGREILSGSEDGTVRIHDAASGEERLAFYGLTGKVMDVDISADGKLIAAIATDGFKKVWDRQLSSEAALLPKRPAANKPAVAKDADGWEDLLAPLTEAKVEKTGQGWSLKDGELFSPDTKFATLPLPGELSGTSYQVRVKLRRHTGNTVFHLVLPVSVGMTGFELDGQKGKYTGLHMVNGMPVKDTPGGLTTPQVNDAEPHVLDVTVRLDGENTTITTTLDGQPLYEWTGPTAALSQSKPWATTEPGALALGTYAGGWAVSEVKLKRLEAGK